MKSFLVPVLCAVALSGSAQAAPDAAEIMRKSEQARRLEGVTADATMTTRESGKEPKVKTFAWWRKLTEQGRFNTLTRFKTPADIKGEAILFLERGTEKNDVFLYLPTYKKVRRVETASQRTSFMGTAFSYSDIAAPHADDYRHKYLRAEACPDEASKSCHVIESVPLTEEVKDRTGYARAVQWIHPEHFLPVRAEFHGDEGLAKRLFASKIALVDRARGGWMAHHLRIEEVANGRSTVLEFSAVKSNPNIADALFNPRSFAGE